MHCRIFRGEREPLLAKLLDAELLDRYGQYLQEQSGALAEPALATYVKQMQAMVARLASVGVDEVRSEDPAGLDALLTDCFAVATWNDWDLPVRDVGEDDCELDGAQRGLLGYDDSEGGAELYVLGDDRIALCRAREVGGGSDLRQHGVGPT